SAGVVAVSSTVSCRMAAMITIGSATPASFTRMCARSMGWLMYGDASRSLRRWCRCFPAANASALSTGPSSAPSSGKGALVMARLSHGGPLVASRAVGPERGRAGRAPADPAGELHQEEERENREHRHGEAGEPFPEVREREADEVDELRGGGLD